MKVNIEEKTKRLSDIISKNDYIEHLEDMVWDEDIVIDPGFYLEVYINPDGVYGDEDGEHSSNGYSIFRYINKDITLGEFLNMDLFAEGSLRDSTMTIFVIPNEDSLFEEERNLCTPYSHKSLRRDYVLL